jgi:lipopolysaccharide/colanic/teichoic acid biosynthesis glycosyltransferase
MAMTPSRPKGYALKRTVDIVGATFGLIVFSVPLLLVALAVRLKLGSPVFFRQERAGFAGRKFRMIKFRSMTDARGPDGQLLPDDQRLPRFGKLLRSTSLDELPELINVLKGDMSLVGPRPLLVRYLERYSPEQARRHEVRPGLTGWSQVNGRNAVSWEERFEQDVWYVDNVSLALDLKIILMTIGKVIKRSGVSAGDHVTMTEFMGSESGK